MIVIQIGKARAAMNHETGVWSSPDKDLAERLNAWTELFNRWYYSPSMGDPRIAAVNQLVERLKGKILELTFPEPKYPPDAVF